ncbi:MAG: hypothetical protein QME96_09585, partial [Myxococcota bacterium]|nr:hypothetical protein [Myxococcota bacterium]
SRPGFEVGPAGPAGAIDATAAEAPTIGEHPEPILLATIELIGMPRGARATVDGRSVDAVFELEVSDELHTLRVETPEKKLFVHRFRARKDTTILVSMRQRAGGGPVDGTGAAAERPAPDAGAAAPADAGRVRDVGQMANPFGTP